MLALLSNRRLLRDYFDSAKTSCLASISLVLHCGLKFRYCSLNSLVPSSSFRINYKIDFCYYKDSSLLSLGAFETQHSCW